MEKQGPQSDSDREQRKRKKRKKRSDQPRTRVSPGRRSLKQLLPALEAGRGKLARPASTGDGLDDQPLDVLAPGKRTMTQSLDKVRALAHKPSASLAAPGKRAMTSALSEVTTAAEQLAKQADSGTADLGGKVRGAVNATVGKSRRHGRGKGSPGKTAGASHDAADTGSGTAPLGEVIGAGAVLPLDQAMAKLEDAAGKLGEVPDPLTGLGDPLAKARSTIEGALGDVTSKVNGKLGDVSGKLAAPLDQASAMLGGGLGGAIEQGLSQVTGPLGEALAMLDIGDLATRPSTSGDASDDSDGRDTNQPSATAERDDLASTPTPEPGTTVLGKPLVDPNPVLRSQQDADKVAGQTDSGVASKLPGAGDQVEEGATQAGGSPVAIADGQGLVGDAHRPVGERIASPAKAMAVARALAGGDLRALADVGITAPGGFDPQAMVWGVGKTSDGDCMLVRGGAEGVDWSQFPGVDAVGHSQPFNAERALTGAGTDGTLGIGELVGKGGDDLARLLPSATALAQHGPGHVVTTPYVDRGQGRIGNPAPGGGAASVDVVVHEAGHAGAMTGTAVAVTRAVVELRAGDKSLWKGVVFAAQHPMLGSLVSQDASHFGVEGGPASSGSASSGGSSSGGSSSGGSSRNA